MQRTACRGLMRCLFYACQDRFQPASMLALKAGSSHVSGCLSSTGPPSRLCSSRLFLHSLAFCYHRSDVPDDAPKISVTFIDRDGSEFNVQASVGEDMLSVAHRKDIDLEGACEGSLACSTCHVVIDGKEMFDKIPEANDDENDMLDLAFGLTETSRLGCQVIAQPELDGMVMRIPDATRNFAVDGHRPKPH